MRPVLVAAPAVDAEHVLEMATTDDENSVETISAESADPAFGVSVRVRRVGFVNSIRPQIRQIYAGTECGRTPHDWQVNGGKDARFAGDSRAEADGTRTRDLRRDTASLARFRPEPTRKEVSALLALTDSAVQAVKDIVSSSDQIPETAGLRMVAERAGTQATLQVSVVPLPAEDDEVIEEQGARVFLEPEAAALLDDKVLDASVEHNQVAFTIADHGEE